MLTKLVGQDFKTCSKCSESHYIPSGSMCLPCLKLKIKAPELGDMGIPKAWEEPNEIKPNELPF